jgi:hypothetical protein
MRFLQNSDYYKYIKQNVLEQVINSDYDLLTDVENASILEVSGYIGVRYDRAKIFASINDYDNAISYPLDTRVLYNGSLYYVIAENGTTAGALPDATPLEYTLGDTRNPLILQILIDVVLFKILKRTNPRNIPQLRVDAYNEAKLMLDQINKGEIMAYDLPDNTANAEFSNTIVTGSSRTTKTSTYY